MGCSNYYAIAHRIVYDFFIYDLAFLTTDTIFSLEYVMQEKNEFNSEVRDSIKKILKDAL